MNSLSDQRAWVYLGDLADVAAPARDFAGYVKSLVERETLAPAGFVTDSVYWAVIDGEVVGRISLRHELNKFLEKAGGHIGYIVRPSSRGKGIATEMLRQILLADRAKSIGKLLLTCDESNPGSARTIQKNGGVLENVIEMGEGKPRKMRFWINL